MPVSGIPTPPTGAITSTFQVGTYTPLTDTFTSVFDLNDGVTTNIMWNTLRMPQPEKAFVRSFNLRAPGERVTRFQYKNRHIQVSVSLRGASVQAILNTCRSLIAAIENPPYRLRLALPNATQYTYASVVAVTHNIPADPQTLLAKALPNVQIDFECLPGLLGDRVTLQNLVVNPGFEAPSGPGVTAFSDTFASTNAYALQAGGAPTLSLANTFVDIVNANGGANLLRYYRLGESSGTVAYDISGMANHGTFVATPTLGVAGGVSGDSDTAITLNGTTQYVDCPTVGMPTGNSPITLLKRFKFASNPAANSYLMDFGAATGGAHNYIALYIDSTGKLHATTGVTDSISAAGVSTGTYHTAALTWDGTNLIGYLDGVSMGSVAPGANTIPTTGLKFRLGATADTSAAGFFAGQLDEGMVFNATLTPTQISNIHTAANTGATGTVANVMSVPAAARVAFGSPAWGALQTWQIRFRWVTNLAARFYPHFTDGSNWTRILVGQATLAFHESVAGTTTLLASSAPTLTHEAWYWLQVTQFPAAPGTAPQVQATLFYDDAGAIGSAVTNGAVGPVATVDAVTALSGRPQIEAVSAPLAIGGNFSSVHTVSLFGPGGWSFGGTSGTATGPSSLAWEQNTANTYPNGPVTSYGAARIDVPPAGTADARLGTWDGTASTVGQYGIPTAQSHVLGLSVAYKTTAGLSATSMVQLLILEYNSSGVQQGVTAAQTILNGTTATSWSSYSGTYTVQNAATAFVRIQLRVVDTTAGGSANATVWFDNIQCWDQTTTGQTSMPYCELRFPQSPAQLMVSGILGDMPAPAEVSLGAYESSLPAGAALTVVLGRRGQVSAAMQLIGNTYDGTPPATTPVLDASSYGGWYAHNTLSTSPNHYANVLALSPKTSDALGAYHLYIRAWSAASTLANVYARMVAYQQKTQWGELTNALYAYYGSYLSPIFTNSSRWTPVDTGQIIIPIAPQGALADPTATYASLVPQVVDGTSTWELRMNWAALIPVDTETVVLLVNNPGNGAPFSNQWLWLYVDGAGVSTVPGQIASTYSLETTPLANPGAGAGGVGTQGTGYINVNSLATPYMLLDPTLTIGGTSVNQFAGLITDANGAVLSQHAEFSYTPLYLYPR